MIDGSPINIAVRNPQLQFAAGRTMLYLSLSFEGGELLPRFSMLHVLVGWDVVGVKLPFFSIS